MNDPNLGRLERVDLRDVWKDEARDFTPWLARPENLELLESTLGLELDADTVETEKDVGSLRADILCRDTGSGDWVLIENQLERANHGHLGQLLTYAAGQRAMTGVWIAAHFGKEYRETLDWLNEITDEKIRFFGIEIEMWKIGESLRAPKFNVVSKPSGWSPETARTVRGPALTKTRESRMAYWAAFNTTLDDVGGPVSGITPQPDAWMAYGAGREGFTVQARMAHTKKLIWTELNIRGRGAKGYFKLLERQREEIEREAGFEMKWLEQPQWQNCRIEHSLDGVNPFDEEDWPRQHKWLADRLNAMHSAFSPRIRNLNPADLPNDNPTDLPNDEDE